MEREGPRGKGQPDQKSRIRPGLNGQEETADQANTQPDLTSHQQMVLSYQQLHGNAKTGALIRRLRADAATSITKVSGSPVQATQIAPGTLQESIVNQPVSGTTPATAGTTVAMQTHDYSVKPGYTMSRRGAPNTDIL